LIDQGVDGNTVIIYTSDNGYFWGEHRLDSKTLPYEEALRVPLIIRPADKIHRPDVTSLVLNVDLTATIVDLADDVVDVVPTLTPQDGQSLVPFLKGVPPDPAWRTDFLFEAWEDGDGMPKFEGVKSASLGKYVEYANGEKEYYTPGDTHELDNLVADPGHATAVSSLAARLQALRPPAEPPDLIFASSFELGDLRRWSLGPVSPDLVVSHEAALFDDQVTAFGLKVVVDATPDARFVQDDAPDNEPRYRARFHFHPNGFDPGPSGEVVLFFAGKDAEPPQPSRRLVIIALQKVGVDYYLMARVRGVEDANGDADVPEVGPFKITNPQLQHRVEFEWRKAGDTTPPHDGYFRIWIDSKDPVPGHAEQSTRTNLGTGQHAVDFGRLGAISVHTGASGSLYLDGFVSHRSTADP
jgi:hypothetical protein